MNDINYVGTDISLQLKTDKIVLLNHCIMYTFVYFSIFTNIKNIHQNTTSKDLNIKANTVYHNSQTIHYNLSGYSVFNTKKQK